MSAAPQDNILYCHHDAFFLEISANSVRQSISDKKISFFVCLFVFIFSSCKCYRQNKMLPLLETYFTSAVRVWEICQTF